MDLGEIYQNTHVNNIYGHLEDRSDIVIAMGDYNSVQGLARNDSNAAENIIIDTLAKVNIENILVLQLQYHDVDNRTPMFCLKVPDRGLYLAVDNRGLATLSSKKTWLTVDYSTVDRKPRPTLLAGALYSLMIMETRRVIKWNIANHEQHGDLIICLPTRWYEKHHDVCVKQSGIDKLISAVNRPTFKGWTTRSWCEQAAGVRYCTPNERCGSCLGFTEHADRVCYPKFTPTTQRPTLQTNGIQRSSGKFPLAQTPTRVPPQQQYTTGAASSEPLKYDNDMLVANTDYSALFAVLAIFIIAIIIVLAMSYRTL